MLIQNKILTPSHGKPFLMDVHAKDDGIPKPIIIFSHGFKGFKDWGHWGVIGDYFANHGIVFIKFNFSHNGTTLENPIDFDDLPAFGENNFSKELADLDAVLNWVEQNENPNFDQKNISLIGHSRGGATSILKAAKDDRVHRLITWASVDQVDYAWKKPSFVERWRNDGVIYAKNGRTKQNMPLNFQLYEDFMKNKDDFDFKQLAPTFDKPYLILHGDNDPAVPLSSAENLHKRFKNSKLKIISNANHVFNGFHPYNLTDLPAETLVLVKETLDFCKRD